MQQDTVKGDFAMPKKTKHKSAPRRPQPRRENEPGQSGIAGALICAGRAALIACAVGAVLLFVLTAVAYAQDDPDAMVRPLGYAIAAIVALTAGAVTSHQNGRQVLLCGLLAAAALLLIFAALSFLPMFADREPMATGLSLGLHAALLPLSIAGAYLGRRRGRR